MCTVQSNPGLVQQAMEMMQKLPPDQLAAMQQHAMAGAGGYVTVVHPSFGPAAGWPCCWRDGCNLIVASDDSRCMPLSQNCMAAACFFVSHSLHTVLGK